MSRKNENGIYVNYDNISCDRYSFEVTAERLREYIDQVVVTALAKGMVGEGCFEFNIHRGYDGGYDDLSILYEFERVETEKEKASREKAEAAEKARRAKAAKVAAEKRKMKTDAEYAEFLRLKEKFKEVN